MSYKKFTKQDRKRLKRKITAMLTDQGKMSLAQIADYLNGQKEPHPNSSSWTHKEAGNFLNRNGIILRKMKSTRTRTYTRKLAPSFHPNSDRVSIAEIVLASNLSNDEKEKVIRSVFGATN